MMTNIDFCYWLQGYFEIGEKTHLTIDKINTIQGMLNKIEEPLGQFTQWLANLFQYFEEQNYQQPIIDFFEKEIKNELNQLFHHVVENE